MTQHSESLPKRWFVPYPEKKSRAGHPCQIACGGSQKMGFLLEYFLREASWELERQSLPESCKVVVLTRSHKDILDHVKISEKSLVEFLKTFHEWGFILNERYSKIFTMQRDPIHEAMHNPKSCKVEVATSTFSLLEEALQRIETLEQESCKVEVKLKQLQELQLYNFALQTKLEAASQELEDLKSKSCNVYPNVEALQLYNFSSEWIQAVSDMLGLPVPFRDIERDITKETKEILFGDDSRIPVEENSSFPIGNEYEKDSFPGSPMTMGNETDDLEEDPDKTEKMEVTRLPKQEESEALRHADTDPDHSGLNHHGVPQPPVDDTGDQGAPLRDECGTRTTTQTEAQVDPTQYPPATSLSNSSRQGSDTSQGSVAPPLFPFSLDAPQVPDGSLPESSNAPAEATYTTTEEWEVARKVYLEGISTTWKAMSKTEKTAHGGKWQTYEKEQRLAWEQVNPKPADKPLEEACRTIYTRLTTEWRGFVSEEKAEVINDHKYIRCFVLKFRKEYPDAVALFENIYLHLTTYHIKWSSVSYCKHVGGMVVYREAQAVIELWKHPPKQNGRQPYNGTQDSTGTNIVTINGKQRKTYSNGLTEFDFESMGSKTYAAQAQ